jgi:hypothetical protein
MSAEDRVARAKRLEAQCLNELSLKQLKAWIEEDEEAKTNEVRHSTILYHTIPYRTIEYDVIFLSSFLYMVHVLSFGCILCIYACVLVILRCWL